MKVEVKYRVKAGYIYLSIYYLFIHTTNIYYPPHNQKGLKMGHATEQTKQQREALRRSILVQGKKVEVMSLVTLPSRGKQKVCKVYTLAPLFGKAFSEVMWEDKTWEMSVDHMLDIFYGCVNPDNVGAPEGWGTEGEPFILSSIITVTTVDDGIAMDNLCANVQLMPTEKMDEWIAKLDKGMSLYLP